MISLRLPGLPAVFTFLRMMKIPVPMKEIRARYSRQNSQKVKSLRRLGGAFSFSPLPLPLGRLRRIDEHENSFSPEDTCSHRRYPCSFFYFPLPGKSRRSCKHDSIASRLSDSSLFSRIVYIDPLFVAFSRTLVKRSTFWWLVKEKRRQRVDSARDEVTTQRLGNKREV